MVIICATGATAFANTQQVADDLFAESKWEDAAAAYETLLRNNDQSASNWMNLGAALEQLRRYEDARRAYDRAITAGYTPVPRARLALARVLAELNEKNLALEQLEEVAQTGGPGFRSVRDTPSFAGIREEPRFVAVIAALTPCTAPEYRHFDFWLGEWDVTSAGSTQPTATSSISSLHDGCVVLEQYVAGAFTGMSINFYDSGLGKWHQSWMSNAGSSVYLEGGLDAQGAMVMSDADLPVSKITGVIGKTTWTPNSDGSVRQLWESSTDGGETWTIVFDGLYRKKDDE